MAGTVGAFQHCRWRAEPTALARMLLLTELPELQIPGRARGCDNVWPQENDGVHRVRATPEVVLLCAARDAPNHNVAQRIT